MGPSAAPAQESSRVTVPLAKQEVSKGSVALNGYLHT